MPLMLWLADVNARPTIVLKDGEDPQVVDLYKGKQLEVSDKDPYVKRAIAREFAKWIADPEKSAHTTPEGEPSTVDAKTPPPEESTTTDEEAE